LSPKNFKDAMSWKDRQE
jgi:hypothetical protein